MLNEGFVDARPMHKRHHNVADLPDVVDNWWPGKPKEMPQATFVPQNKKFPNPLPKFEEAQSAGRQEGSAKKQDQNAAGTRIYDSSFWKAKASAAKSRAQAAGQEYLLTVQPKRTTTKTPTARAAG